MDGIEFANKLKEFKDKSIPEALEEIALIWNDLSDADQKLNSAQMAGDKSITEKLFTHKNNI